MLAVVVQKITRLDGNHTHRWTTDRKTQQYLSNLKKTLCSVESNLKQSAHTRTHFRQVTDLQVTSQGTLNKLQKTQNLIIHASVIYLFFQVYIEVIEPRGIFQFDIIIMNRKSGSFFVVIFTFLFWFTFQVLYLFNVHAWANLKNVHFRLLFHRFKNS